MPEVLDHYLGRNRPIPEPSPVDYKIRQSGPSGIEQAPNYERLTRVEKWVSRRLPGFAETTVGQALAKFNESWAGQALQVLDWPAEQIERGTGLAAQLIHAYAGGSELDPEGAQDVISNINAAWFAGSLAADMANFTPKYNTATGRIEIPQDLPGIQGVVGARKEIASLIKQGMEPAEALAQVRDNYYNSQGALALRSQTQDTFMHIFADPIDLVLPILKPIERTAKYRTILRNRVLGETVTEVVQEAEHLREGISVAKNQLSLLDEVEDIEHVVGLTRHLRQLEEELPLIEDAVKFAKANQLTPFQENMVRMFKLLPDEKLPDIEEMSKLGRLAYRYNPLALTPGARAHELMNTVLQRIQTTVFHSGGGPNEWVRAVVRGADGIHSPELAQSLLTIEGRSVRAALKRASEEAQGILGAYNRLEELEGPFIRNMSEILGTTPDKIISRLSNGEETALASQYMQKLAKIVPEERARIEMLFRGNGLNLNNEQDLLETIGKLKQYENFVAWDDTMFQFELANKLIDGIQEMSLTHFGLKARGTILQAADAMKAAESLAFLKMNPAYPMRNWINNFFTTIGRGTYGNPFEDMAKFWKKVGLSEPPRLRQGVGMAGEIDFTAAAERTLTASLERGSQLIRKVENPQKGWIGDVTRFLQKRKGLGFGELAQRFERQASVRAYTTGFIRHYKQTNRVGKGVTSIDEFAPALANSLGNDVVRRIHDAVEGAYTHADLDDILLNKNLNLNINAVMKEASERTGLDLEQIMGDDFHEYVGGRLEEAMLKGEDSVREEVRQIRKLIARQLESHVDEANYTILHETASLVNAEGPGALPQVFSNLLDDEIATAERHAMDMAKIGGELRTLKPEARKIFWNNLLEDNKQFYNRFWNRSDKYIEGVEKGLDDAMEQLRLSNRLTPEIEKALGDMKIEVRSNFGQWRDGWQGYFEFRNNEFKRLSRFKNEDNFLEAWRKLELDLDKRYNKLIDAETVHMGRMDEAISRQLPETQRNMFMYYRGKISDVRREMREHTLRFRREVRGVRPAERNKLWKEQFWPERIDILKRLETAERDMRVAMQGNPKAQHLFGLTEDEASRIGDIQRRFLQGEDLATEETALLNKIRQQIRQSPEVADLRNRWGTYSKRQMADYFTDIQAEIRHTDVLDEGVRILGLGDDGFPSAGDPEVQSFVLNWAEENAPSDFTRLEEIRSGLGQQAGQGITKIETFDDATRLIDQVPPPPEGTIRVYRADSIPTGKKAPEWIQQARKEQGLNKVHGRWHTDDIETLEFYFEDAPMPEITFQDVPEEIVRQSKNNDAVERWSINPDNEMFLPEEYAGKGTNILDAVEANQPAIPGLETALADEAAAIENKLLNRMQAEYFTPSEALQLWTDGKISKEQFVIAATTYPDELDEVYSLSQWQMREQGMTTVKAYYNADDLAETEIIKFDRLQLDRTAAKSGGGQLVEVEVPVENVLVHPSAHPGMGSEIVLTEDGISGARIASIDGRDISSTEFNAILSKNPDIAGAPATLSAMSDFHGVVPRQLVMGKGIDELWFTRGNQALNAIEESAIDATRKPALAVDVPEGMEGQIRGYLEHIKGEQSRNLYAGYRMGEWHRDSALLNYNRRMNYNNWLGAVVPYEFWATNTAFRWAMHSIDRPGMLTNFLRIKKFLNTAYKPENGFPSRLQGTIRVPLPFAPDWMGDDLFIDPLSTALPFDQFAYGLERYSAQKKSDMGKAERVLEELLNDGQISEQEYQHAITNHEGPTWERALALGQQDDSEDRISAFDTVSMMLSPHAPIMWAHNISRGTPENISPFLPITRSIKGVSALLGINPEHGGVNPEASIRKAMGLPAFDKWDDYRIDRMLSNMAATNEYAIEDVLRAMRERNGEIFVEARRRAGIEYGWGSMGSLTGIPTKAYPVGEEHLRGLREQYEQAWKDYENGKIGAVNQFYEDHPEYESRLALWDSPEERMRNFLVGELWDKWHDMPDVHKDEVKQHLGGLFQQAFLDRETRATDAIDMNTLQYWVSVMGGDEPGKLELSPNIPPLELTDRDTAYRVQVFYDARERLFDYYNAVAPLQNDYYKLEEGAARRQFRRSHPELVDYWNWRRDFMKRNPALAPFITDNPDSLPQYSSEQELRQVEEAEPMFRPEEWENYLGSNLYRLVLDDDPLPPTAQRVLDELGVSQMQVRGQILAQIQ